MGKIEVTNRIVFNYSLGMMGILIYILRDFFFEGEIYGTINVIACNLFSAAGEWWL